MRLMRIAFAGALLFGAGCVLTDEGDQPVDPASLDDVTDDQSAALFSEVRVGDQDRESSSDGAEAALAGEGELQGSNYYWVCWYCYEDEDHDGDSLAGKDECREEYCYHGKHKKKGKAKDKAEDACEDDYGHCYFKYCKKFY